MQLPVVDTQGTQVGTLEVSDHLFAVPMNASVVHQAMVWQRANARQGTSSTKTRGDVSGGGVKPRPQKYTGRSRQGSIRAPQWRHGGVVFGPHPRSYRQRIPKKVRRLAIRCLLSDKVRGNNLTVLQSMELSETKTQEMKRILGALNATSSALVVTPEKDNNVVISARNLEHVKTLPAPNLNVLDLLQFHRLVMTVAAVRKAEEMWAGTPAPQQQAEAPKEPAPKPRARRASAQGQQEQPGQPQSAEPTGEA